MTESVMITNAKQIKSILYLERHSLLYFLLIWDFKIAVTDLV